MVQTQWEPGTCSSQQGHHRLGTDHHTLPTLDSSCICSSSPSPARGRPGRWLKGRTFPSPPSAAHPHGIARIPSGKELLPPYDGLRWWEVSLPISSRSLVPPRAAQDLLLHIAATWPHPQSKSKSCPRAMGT